MGGKYIHIHDDFAQFDSIIIDFFWWIWSFWTPTSKFLNEPSADFREISPTKLPECSGKWYFVHIFGNQGHVRLILSIYRMVASASQCTWLQNYQLTIELYLLKEKILQFSQAFDQGYTLKHLYCAYNTYTVYEFTYIYYIIFIDIWIYIYI